MQLIFVRHGDPDYVHDTLTKRGIREAEALRERAVKWNADGYFCSPLGRAKRTAEIALSGTGIVPEEKDWLREFMIRVDDPVTGEKRIPWDFMPAWFTKQPDLYDKDTWYKNAQMQTGDIEKEYIRVCRGIDELLSAYGYVRKDGMYITAKGNSKKLVFFCHLGVQFVILSHLFGVSAPVLWQQFFVAPTSVTVVGTEEREEGKVSFRCKRMGDISHLYAAGITPSESGFFGDPL